MDKFTLSRVLWRSFFLQAAWNNRGKQNLGLAAAMQPVFQKICGRWTPGLTDAMLRSLEPFNTHPYMVGIILGAMIRLEEDEGFTLEKRVRIYRALSTAFAAIGDAFFWNGLLPTAGVIAMFWAFETDATGAVVFLVLYNTAHLVVRLVGFCLGYRYGVNAIKIIDRLKLPLLTIHLRFFLASALGGLAAWIFESVPILAGDGPWTWPVGLIAFPAVYLFYFILQRGAPVEVIIYGLFGLMVVLGFIAF